MEYSEFLGLSLPSRDNDTDIADINVLSNNFETLDTFCGKTIPDMLQGVGDEFVEVTEAVDNKYKSLDLLGFFDRDRHKGFISADGKWTAISDNYQFILLPVYGGAKLNITSNGVINGTVACLRSFSGAIEGGSVDFSVVSEWSKRYDFSGNKQLTIPNDAKYLWISVVYSGQDSAPVECEIGGYDYLASAQKNIQDIYTLIGGIENGSY